MIQETTPAPAPASAPPGGGGRRPGGPGRRPRPKSRYGMQMAEKQQLKEIYGISETQLRNYYREAHRRRGDTGTYLISLLERRVDNAVFRAGFAVTRPSARQMVSHKMFQVNGRTINVASYSLKPGDVVMIKESKRGKSLFANFPKSLQNVNLPSWIELTPDSFSFKVTALPSGEEANVGVNILSVVEFFAR
jgi:small subunit ribosomal protein S4